MRVIYLSRFDQTFPCPKCSAKMHLLGDKLFCYKCRFSEKVALIPPEEEAKFARERAKVIEEMPQSD